MALLRNGTVYEWLVGYVLNVKLDINITVFLDQIETKHYQSKCRVHQRPQTAIIDVNGIESDMEMYECFFASFCYRKRHSSRARIVVDIICTVAVVN